MVELSEHAKITDFQPDKANANVGTQQGRRVLDHSIGKLGLGRSILVDKHGNVIAGNKAQEVALDLGLEDAIVVKTKGDKLVVVQREDLDLYEGDTARQLAYADNRSSEMGLEWDIEQIVTDLDAGIELQGIFGDDALKEMLEGFADGLLGEDELTPEMAHKTLAERFIVPPFSVLDARQGYWQERKRAWLALGIQSELGRGEATPTGGSLRDAATLGPDGKTVRGDGKGRPITERERVATKMAMHNDPMQRKARYDNTPDASGRT